MNRISLITLFLSIVLLSAQDAPKSCAQARVQLPARTQLPDGGSCIPTGPTSCPGGKYGHYSAGAGKQLADGTTCIPTGPTACVPHSTTGPDVQSPEKKQVADGGSCIPTSPT